MSKRQLPLFPSQPQTPHDISAQTPLDVTLAHFGDYLRREGKSQHTIKAFLGDMQLLGQHSDGKTPVGQFTTQGLNAYLNWMEKERGVACSRKTYARRVTTLKVYFKWLTDLGALSHDPAAAVIQRSGPAPLSSVLTPDQIRAALNVARSYKKGDHVDYRPEVLFCLLLDTGIKKGETTRLTVDALDRLNDKRPVLYIRHNVRNIYKERRLTLDADWLKLFDLYAAQYSVTDTIFTCTARNLEYILTDIGVQAGIPFKLSFEGMRWTSAVRDYLRGDDEDAIRDKLGLSKTSWYETYAKIRRLAERIQNDEIESGERNEGPEGSQEAVSE